MRRPGEIGGNGRGTGIGAPIVWSAAGHLLVLLAILSLHPGAPVLSLPGVVEVLLVSANERPAENLSPAPMPVRPGKAQGAGEEASRARTVRPALFPPTVAGRPDVGGKEPAPEPAAVPPPGSAESPPIREPAAPVPAAEVPLPSAPAPRLLPKRHGNLRAGTGGGSGETGREGTPAERTTPPATEAAGIPLGGSGSSAEGAGRALALLRARIQERIVYPVEAVRRGQEGEVLLRIRIGVGGVPREIRVAKSSGARILDEAARRGVVRAAPLPSDPGWFEIPVRFSLR